MEKETKKINETVVIGTVEFLSPSTKNNSFKLAEGPEWYSVQTFDVEHTIKKGDEVKVNFVLEGSHRDVVSIDITGKAPVEYNRPKFQGKNKSGGSWAEDMVDFETLLSDAHEKFKDKFDIKTILVSHDMERKAAIFKAEVHTQNGIFEAHGDADQINCQSDMIKPHYIRMAETRAIARALRWATNNAKTSKEEVQ